MDMGQEQILGERAVYHRNLFDAVVVTIVYRRYFQWCAKSLLYPRSKCHHALPRAKTAGF